MLLGEHAVLHGHRALVMAVDQRLRVELTPRDDDRVEIVSALGRHATTLHDCAPHPQFRFLLEAIRRHAARCPRGFTLRVESEFSHTIGFGSSAAVTVAGVAALRRHIGLPVDEPAIRDESIAIIRAVQGRGSGGDVAASTHGGVVVYRAEPREAERLPVSLEGLAVYCGYKIPTPEVIRRVDEQWAGREPARDALYERMDACVGDALNALASGDIPRFGAVLNAGQALLEELGVNTPELAEIVTALRGDPGIHGAKISGSGLGDCVFGLGRVTRPPSDYQPIPIRTAPQGLRFLTPRE